jgi:hypothetical protein
VEAQKISITQKSIRRDEQSEKGIEENCGVAFIGRVFVKRCGRVFQEG